LIKIRIHILILCFSMGCSTFQWKQPVYRSPELPLVVNQYQSLGTGLKLSDIGYHAMPCLKSFETELTGGVLDMEFRKIDSDYEGHNLEIDRFIKSSLKRSTEFNLESGDPASFVLIIRMKNRMASVREETIEYRKDVEALIDSDNLELFFRTCGTEYIQTAKFDSEIYFFFSYYPDSELSATLLEKEIKRKITENGNNVFQVGIFKDLELDAETYFSLKVDTDILFEPIEFAFKVNRLLKTLGKKEQTADLLDCATALGKVNQHMSWSNYEGCRQAAIFSKTVDLESIAECSPITKGISYLNLSKKCLGQYGKEESGPVYLNDNIYLPLELVDRLVEDPLSIHRKETGYRFNDEEQTESIPENVILGQGVDSTGLFYKENCIVEGSKQIGDKDIKRNIAITNDYYPYEKREWPLLKKAFLFWQDSPQWTLYRGSFEVEGFSPVLLPNFKITDEAKKLAATSIVSFYKKFGTHYVERIRHRRGFIYYFSPDSIRTHDIKIIPFGMPIPKRDTSLIDEYIDKIPFLGKGNDRSCSLELSGLLLFPILSVAGGNVLFGAALGVDCQDDIPPLLDPKTVKAFFVNKEKLIMMFKDDENAVPVRLSLKPWSEYLVNRGILKPEQLDLAELVE